MKFIYTFAMVKNKLTNMEYGMNCMHDLSIGQHKRIWICEWLWLKIVEASFITILCNFLNKWNLKRTKWYIRIYIHYTGQCKTDQTFSFLHGVLSYFFSIFLSNFLNWIRILNILFMQAGLGVATPTWGGGWEAR